MNTPTAAVAGPGHNNPPSPIEELSQRMSAEFAGYLTRAQELADKAKLVVVPASEEDAQKLTELGVDISNLAKDMEKLRKEQKAPHMALADTVDGFFNPIVKNLESLIANGKPGQQPGIVKKCLSAWLQEKAAKEQDRLNKAAEAARAQAEKEAAEAERIAKVNTVAGEAVFEQAVATETMAVKLETAATGVGAGVAAVRGAGAMASQAKTWQGVIENMEELDLNILRPYLAHDALQTALNKAVKAGIREIKGAVIEEVISTRLR